MAVGGRGGGNPSPTSAPRNGDEREKWWHYLCPGEPRRRAVVHWWTTERVYLTRFGDPVIMLSCPDHEDPPLADGPQEPDGWRGDRGGLR